MMIQCPAVTATILDARRLAVLALVALCTIPSIARAHDLIDEGRTLYEEAEFVAAIDAFARAEAATDLTTADLGEMYEVRALVHLAMGNEQAMRADIGRLATVAPEFELDRRVPPEVRRAFAEARANRGAPLRMTAGPTGDAEGVTIAVTVENDTADLVREVRIFGRGASDGYETASDAPLTIDPDGSTMVDYYALALGPGGAILATSGSADEPLRFRVSGAGATEAVEAEDKGGSALPWVLVGVGVLAVAAGVIIAILVAGGNDDEGNTNVSPFVVRF